MKNSGCKWFFIFIPFYFLSNAYSACEGRGTVIFYGNGMLNAHYDATFSKYLLRGVSEISLKQPNRELLFANAYNRNEPLLEKLVEVAEQKGVTEFENFWAWLASMESAPPWFVEALQMHVLQVNQKILKVFPDLKVHFEEYSDYLNKGYNVILVSHSQGNFYANQAMRKLNTYPDNRLTGTLEQKKAENEQFPNFRDLFANVQVATPVLATVDGSPWTTFADDLIIGAVREAVGALPANIKSAGAGAPPLGDFLGHNFVNAYLHDKESRNKIVNDIKTAQHRLRFPIAYFQPAILIEKDATSDPNSNIFFTIHAEKNGGNLQLSRDEKSPDGSVADQAFVTCFELPMGETKITAQTIVEDESSHTFEFRIWPEGKMDTQRETPIRQKIVAKRGIQNWDLGVVRAKRGEKENPLAVKTETYTLPKIRH